MTPRVIGIDPSTSSTGIAWPDGRTTTIRADTVAKHDANGSAQRANAISNRVAAAIRRLPNKPDLAVIEDYLLLVGFQNGQHTTRRLVEVGACIRMALASLQVPFVEIPPSSLKIFATGHGGATKEQMVAAARARGGRPRNDDEADAWLLRELGLANFDNDRYEQLDDRQRLIVQTARWPELSTTTGAA